MVKDGDLSAWEKVKQWITAFALMLAVLAIPLHPRWVFYAIILLGALALVTLFVDKKWSVPGPPLVCLMLMFIVRLLWSLGSFQATYTRSVLEADSAFLLLPLIFLLIDITPRVRDITVKTFIAMGFLMVVYSASQLIDSVSRSQEPVMDFFKTYFQNPQFNSQAVLVNWDYGHYGFMSVMLIYGLYLVVFLDTVKSSTRWIITICFTLGVLFFVIFTGTRAGLILLILAFVNFALVRLGFFKRHYWVLGAMAITVVLVLYLGRYHYRKIDSARNDMVEIALKAIRQAPFFGHGTGSLVGLMHEEKFEYNYTTTVNHPHNEYLAELMQFGMIGAIPFFLFLFFAFRESIVDENYPLLGILLTLSIFMLTEAPFHSNKGLLPFLLLVSLLSDKRRIAVKDSFKGAKLFFR